MKSGTFNDSQFMLMIEKQVAAYYSKAYGKYGRQPKGVDWNDDSAQIRRFEALTRHLPKNDSFSVLDYGCGYGALFEFLFTENYSFEYHGYDIAKSIIADATTQYTGVNNVTFYAEIPRDLKVHHAVLNGVFHVKLENDVDDWSAHIEAHLKKLLPHVTDSISVNFLSLKSDPERRKNTLFYAHPVDFVKTISSKLGCTCEVFEHASLYEFIVIIKP